MNHHDECVHVGIIIKKSYALKNDTKPFVKYIVDFPTLNLKKYFLVIGSTTSFSYTCVKFQGTCLAHYDKGQSVGAPYPV